MTHWDVIDTEGVYYIDSGETWENKLIDLGNGKDIKIRANGTNWTVRNVGVKGTWHHTTHEYLFGFSDQSGGESLVENVYIGEGDPTAGSDERGGCVWVPHDHSGKLTFRNVNFNIEGALGVYGHYPGQPGEGGGVLHFENCYCNDNHHTGLRFSSNGTTVQDTVIYKSGDRAANRGFWIWEGTNGPGNSADLNNVDIITNGVGVDIDTRDDPIVNLTSVRSDDGYPGTDPNPNHYVPDGCPTSAEEAAEGEDTSSYDTIQADGQLLMSSDFENNTIENLLIDCTTGNDIRLYADGDNPTIRNIGFEGLYYGTQFAIQIGSDSAATGDVTIDNIYLGDGCTQENSSHAHGPGGVFYHSNANANSVSISNVTVRGFSNNAFYLENNDGEAPITWDSCYTVNCGVTHYRSGDPGDEMHNCVGYNTDSERYGTSSGGERFGRMIWTRDVANGEIDAYDCHLDGGPRTGASYVAETGTRITVHSGEALGSTSGNVDLAGAGTSPSHDAPSGAPLSADSAASGDGTSGYDGPTSNVSGTQEIFPGDDCVITAGITNTHDTDELYFEGELVVRGLGTVGTDSAWISASTTYNHSETIAYDQFPEAGIYHWEYTVDYGGNWGTEIHNGAVIVEGGDVGTTGTISINHGSGEIAHTLTDYDRVSVNHGDDTGEHVLWERSGTVAEDVITPALTFQQSDLSGWTGSTSDYSIDGDTRFYSGRTVASGAGGFAEMGTFPGDISDRLPAWGDIFRYYWHTDSGTNVSSNHSASMLFFWSGVSDSWVNAVPNLNDGTFHTGVLPSGSSYDQRAQTSIDTSLVGANEWYYTEIDATTTDTIAARVYRADDETPISDEISMSVTETLGSGWALGSNDSAGTIRSGLVAIMNDN